LEKKRVTDQKLKGNKKKRAILIVQGHRKKRENPPEIRRGEGRKTPKSRERGKKKAEGVLSGTPEKKEHGQSFAARQGKAQEKREGGAREKKKKGPSTSGKKGKGA